MLPRDRDLNEGSKWTGINSRLPNIALEVTMVTEQAPLVEFVGVRVFFQVIVVVGLKDCSHFAGRVSG